MANTIFATTSPIQGCTSGFAMPVVTDLSRTSWVVRERKAVATTGHVAFATVPGDHAWSPPLC